MERVSALLSVGLLGLCSASGWFAVSAFRGSADAVAVFYGAVCLLSGVSACGILGAEEGSE